MDKFCIIFSILCFQICLNAEPWILVQAYTIADLEARGREVDARKRKSCATRYGKVWKRIRALMYSLDEIVNK